MTSQNKVGPVRVANYKTFLVDKYRPPSRGGNTRAWHRHSFEVEGDQFSFLALGAKKWIFAKDTVEFNWEWNKTKKYRNVLPETVSTKDADGNIEVRGERGDKKWRTSSVRMPASQREQRD